jgi:lactoylglutathione lyase
VIRSGGGTSGPVEPSGEHAMTKFTFDHIHLFTRDPEATAAFYERMFGAEVIRTTQQGKPRIDLKLGGANIFILDVSQDPKATAGPAHPHQGLDHFGLDVKNIDAVCSELKAKGAVFTRGPETIRPGTRIAFLTGPEGVSIELLERTPV